jgi:hypothetical protein
MGGLKKVISFRIDEKTEKELKKYAELWNLKDRELARKLFLDGLQQIARLSAEITQKQKKKDGA